MNNKQQPTTGFESLDNVLQRIIEGDNIVWQVNSISDYRIFVDRFVSSAIQNERKLIYFRFADHERLLDDACGAEIHELNPGDGFETFISRVHSVIQNAGKGAYYVFDCMSGLSGDWYSDQMLGNFFMLTCPFLYELDTIAYFALYRNYHSSRAIDPISETTQLLLEILRHNEQIYVRPIKTDQRFTPTIHMFHRKDGTQFPTETSSAVISEIHNTSNWAGLGLERGIGLRERTMIEAQEIQEEIARGIVPREQGEQYMERLLKMMISRDKDMLRLVSDYFTLEQVIETGRRMIGTGLIGGKAVGMLLAREILRKSSERFGTLLEMHDSFYVGSDVFYTFLVQNKVWWIRQKQRDPKTFLEDAARAREIIRQGIFPDYILKQLADMMDYFGQSPFIVRSSSLLEDNFGNSFAGKYESVFCPNQGTREERFNELLKAIRTIYASTLTDEALHYRARRNLLEHDEQMALLVMRVSGSMHDSNFFPTVAGVGFSFNPYAWNENIDPKAGVMRLVFGLGTRAVNRSDDDYTRVVALNDPARRPETNFNEICQYSQHRVDYLDLKRNKLSSGNFSELAAHLPAEDLNLIASRDRNADNFHILTFDRLLTKTNFVTDMKKMLKTLQTTYQTPVDIEFTVNFFRDNEYRINLVQCRPLQVQGVEITSLPDIEVNTDNCILKARGAVIGHSRVMQVDRLIYVNPAEYSKLPDGKRYETANLIGKINHHSSSRNKTLALLGPGRWGTSTPSLGVPVTFHDINKTKVLCEIVAMREDLVPDVSLGTHFLNELVEMNVLYLALFPKKNENYFNEDFFLTSPNRLCSILPSAEKWQNILIVIDADTLPEKKRIKLHADTQRQKSICFFE